MTYVKSIKILIVDHTPEFRKILKTALGELSGIEIVGVAANLKSVFTKTRDLSPDLILFDFEMPGTDINRTLNEFKKINPDIEIILTSKTYRTETDTSIKALDLGAYYFLRKPEGNKPAENVNYYKKYLNPIFNLYRINRSTRKVISKKNKLPKPKFQNQSSELTQMHKSDNYSILAIGSSLGGPEALKKFIPLLPADFPIPIVIIQHMPGGFTQILAENIDSNSCLITREVKNGEQIIPGYVYIAPGGHHLMIKRRVTAQGPQYIAVLSQEPPFNGCRPSVDILFKSMIESIKGNILTVILTGMGHDGLKGMKALKKTGRAYCITQDEKSCVVHGMPGAIEDAGLSDLSLPISKIAENIINIVYDKSKSSLKV